MILLGLAFAAPGLRAAPPDKIDPEVRAALRALPPGQMLAVIVTLRDQVQLQQLGAGRPPRDRAERLQTVVTALKNRADLGQRALKPLLAARQAEGKVARPTYYWIFNGLAVTARPEVIEELAARPEVARISSNELAAVPVPFLAEPAGEIAVQSSQPNLSLIHIPALWDQGFHGEGIVVASLDTGVDVTHPALGPKWRGGTNSWFDPYNEHATPTDWAGTSTGHGTQTMGVMVGGQHAGVDFGVAPEARWIAAKIFRDDGASTVAAIHAAFQWVLDPDGDPATPDAPHVVNNSWTLTSQTCDLAYQADLQALRAAGILPVFAAGNYGPNPNTSASPANYPEALAVGAINNFGQIWSASSRGASACDGTIFPEVVAPGVSIHTATRLGGYTNSSGTSLAAPHVSGLLALLLQAHPDLTVAEQEAALLNPAALVDLGLAGPDNVYGQGLVNAQAIFQAFSGGPQVFLPALIR